MSNSLLPPRATTREKMVRLGIANLADSDLIALILGTGRHQLGVTKLAQQICQKYSLASIKHLSLAKLTQIKGLGMAKASRLMASFELAIRLQQNSLVKLNSPRKIFHYCQHLTSLKQEYCYGLYINGRLELLQKKLISAGTFNHSQVEPRQLFRPALTLPAAAIILVHNHPSGDATASEADLTVTKQLQAGANLLGLEITDHVIIGRDNFFSFREHQLI